MGDIPPPRNPPPVHTFPPTPSPLGEPVQQRIPPRSLSWPVCPGDSELQYAPRACTPLGVPANRMIPPRAIRLAGTPSLGKPPRGLSLVFLGGHSPLPHNADFAYACPDPSPRKTNLLFLSSRGLLHLRNDPLPNLEHFAHHTLPKPHRGVQPRRRPSSEDLASGRDSKKGVPTAPPPYGPQRALRSHPDHDDITRDADPNMGRSPRGAGVGRDVSTPTASRTHKPHPG